MSSNNEGGLTMKIMPSKVRQIVKILKSPHRSPRKILLNIATNTGVEKIMTVLKLKNFNRGKKEGRRLLHTYRQVACFEKRKMKISTLEIQQYISAEETFVFLRGKHFRFCRLHTIWREAKLLKICTKNFVNFQ